MSKIVSAPLPLLLSAKPLHDKLFALPAGFDIIQPFHSSIDDIRLFHSFDYSIHQGHSSRTFILTMEDPTIVGRQKKRKAAEQKRAQAGHASEARPAKKEAPQEKVPRGDAAYFTWLENSEKAPAKRAAKRKAQEDEKLGAKAKKQATKAKKKEAPESKSDAKQAPESKAKVKLLSSEQGAAKKAPQAKSKKQATKAKAKKEAPESKLDAKQAPESKANVKLLSSEQGAAKKAPQVKKRKPLTDEQRARKNAKLRQKRQEMTDEQRAAEKAKARQKRQEMSTEEREAFNMKKRQRYREQPAIAENARAKANQRYRGPKREERLETAKLQGKTASRWEPSEREDFHSQINEFLDAEKDLSTEALNDLLAWRDCEEVRDLEGMDKNMTKYAKGSWRLQALAMRKLYDRQLMDDVILESPKAKRAKKYLTKGEQEVLNTAGKLTRGFMRCGGEHSEAVWVTLEHAYDVNDMSAQKGQERARRDAWPPDDPANAKPAELNFDQSFARFEEQCEKNNRQYPEYLRRPPTLHGLLVNCLLVQWSSIANSDPGSTLM